MTENTAGLHDRSDIRRDDWAARHLPPALLPCLRLARLDRPIGTWLLLFPGWWAIALGAQRWPDWRLIALFGIGALVMRGAGCTFNDIVDRDFDARVARTRTRPIPSGAISVPGAILFMLLLLAAGATVLFSLDRAAIALGIPVLLLIATYPFMKRVTYWPQLFLGLNFNWGALMGWAAVRGDVALPAVLLYVGGICWTLGYDTIYAHQDKEDDARIGIKSSARRLGDQSKPWIAGFYMTMVIFTAMAGVTAGFGGLFWLALALAAGHFAWQVRAVDLDRPDSCLAVFKANTGVGWILLAGLIAVRLI